MGPGEAIATVAVAGFLIAALIAGAGMFKRLIAYKERQLELTAENTAEKAAQYASQVQVLEQRVRVLEQIATDKGADLAHKIEALRDEREIEQRFETRETERSV